MTFSFAEFSLKAFSLFLAIYESPDDKKRSPKN
jgi:hypothetical protein